MTLEAFWPVYLGEHRRPATRAWHLAGTLGYLALGTTLVLAGRLRDLWTLPVLAYGCAWVSHAFIERNRPATFRHPVLSLVCDHRMAWYMLTGRMAAELERLGIACRGNQEAGSAR